MRFTSTKSQQSPIYRDRDIRRKSGTNRQTKTHTQTHIYTYTHTYRKKSLEILIGMSKKHNLTSTTIIKAEGLILRKKITIVFFCCCWFSCQNAVDFVSCQKPIFLTNYNYSIVSFRINYFILRNSSIFPPLIIMNRSNQQDAFIQRKTRKVARLP